MTKIKAERLFEKYNAHCEINIIRKNLTSYSLVAEFYYKEDFDKFTDDLNKLKNIDTELELRNNNPTLSRAYEEYQLLLKLIK